MSNRPLQLDRPEQAKHSLFNHAVKRRSYPPRGAHKSGVTLIELMISVSLISVIAIGTMNYQYFSIKHTRASDAQLLATRIGQLLIEDWKSISGDTAYDPESLQLGFQSPESGEFGDYYINLGNIPFFIRLHYDDVEEDEIANVTLRQLSITIRWRRDYSRGGVTGNDPVLTLTTYVRRD